MGEVQIVMDLPSQSPRENFPDIPSPAFQIFSDADIPCEISKMAPAKLLKPFIYGAIFSVVLLFGLIGMDCIPNHFQPFHGREPWSKYPG
jgi:hypothetical protein